MRRRARRGVPTGRRVGRPYEPHALVNRIAAYLAAHPWGELPRRGDRGGAQREPAATDRARAPSAALYERSRRPESARPVPRARRDAGDVTEAPAEADERARAATSVSSKMRAVYISLLMGSVRP